MSFLEAISQPMLIAAATLLVVAAAAGLNLYATLVGLGLASRLGLIPALPPGLTGIENGLVIGTAAGLLLVELIADREPALAGMWHSLHALVKPLAAALLTASALIGRPTEDLLGACILAAAIALLFHGMRYGLRVARRLPDAPRGGVLLTLGEAAAAAALLVTVRYPEAAVPVAAGLLLVAAVVGPLSFRAFRLGMSAQRARLRAFLGETGWKELDVLPGALRAAVPVTPLAGTPPRVTRVGVLRAPGFNRFSRAWLVVDSEGHRLLRQSIRGRRHYRIPAGAAFSIRPGSWADTVEIEAAAEKLQILLMKDGPAPPLVARSLAPEPLSARRVDS